jgi:hypothetical protein
MPYAVLVLIFLVFLEWYISTRKQERKQGNQANSEAWLLNLAASG